MNTMPQPKSQKERIIAILLEEGFVSRNQCFNLFPRITRLAARVDDLKREGWVFETEDDGRDFVYRLVSQPEPKQLELV
jgi:Helix-turn-helix domain